GSLSLQSAQCTRRIARRPDGSGEQRRGRAAAAGAGPSARGSAARERSGRRVGVEGDVQAACVCRAAAGAVHAAARDPARRRPAARSGADDPAGAAGRRGRQAHRHRRARRRARWCVAVERAGTPARRVLAAVHQHGARGRGRRQHARNAFAPGRLSGTLARAAGSRGQCADLSRDPAGDGGAEPAVPARLRGAAVRADVRKPGRRAAAVHAHGAGRRAVRARLVDRADRGAGAGGVVVRPQAPRPGVPRSVRRLAAEAALRRRTRRARGNCPARTHARHAGAQRRAAADRARHRAKRARQSRAGRGCRRRLERGQERRRAVERAVARQALPAPGAADDPGGRGVRRAGYDAGQDRRDVRARNIDRARSHAGRAGAFGDRGAGRRGRHGGARSPDPPLRPYQCGGV
ncbi:MAG: General secretion pathway protein F, partial [uncultured Lysobacter sp.]